MKNETLISFGKEQLKESLSQCTEAQQLMFKRMYSHQNIELPINDVVDAMDEGKIDWALTQVERTLTK